ncbi:MAG: flagellar protein FlgN [Magnetococcales bacterium]|nr:flagellar protein FlgN [Magnetococcales bacterium]
MKEAVVQLREVLADLMSQFERLLQRLEEERQFIRARQVEEMGQSSVAVTEILEKIRQVDRQRQELTAKMARQLKMKAGEITLATLDRELGSNTGLTEDRQRLLTLITEADRSNRENQAILKGVMVATEVVIRAMGGQGQPELSYNRLGSKKNVVGNINNLFSKQL